MKDPFAMLSLPVVTATTGSVAVLLYRHPGAALASYRRMGWEPDLDELGPILQAHRLARGTAEMAPGLPRRGQTDAAQEMGLFWAALYEIALDSAAEVDRLVIVSHEDLAGGGVPAARRLFDVLGLRWTRATTTELLGAADNARGRDERGLHDLNRSSVEVASAWREGVDAREVDTIEAVTADIRQRLFDARLPL